jgi:hypothetical protein
MTVAAPRQARPGACYRLLGAGSVRLTPGQLEDLVRGGLVRPDAKVIRDGEAFAVALNARAEFQRLRVEPKPPADDDEPAA